VMRSCILVRWTLSRACTLRASVKSKRSCIAPWPTHGLRSESCACASAIEETTTPIEQLDQPHFRWVQPSA